MALIIMHDLIPFERFFNIAHDMVVSYGTAYGPYIDICSSYDLEASYGSANGTYIGVCSSYALVAHHMGVLVCDLTCRQLSLKNPVKPFPEFR